MSHDGGDATERDGRTHWPWLLTVGLALVALALPLGVVAREPLGLDAWWNTLLVNDGDVLLPVALVFNWIGGGWFAIALPAAAAIALVAVRRRWAALFLMLASLVSVALVQVLKGLFGRARPEEILVVSDFGSFPSGHTANAATLAIVAAVIWPRAWVVVAGAVWTVLMGLSRTYLHAHWATDTVAGTLVGAGAALIVAAAMAVPMTRERRALAVVPAGSAPTR